MEDDVELEIGWYTDISSTYKVLSCSRQKLARGLNKWICDIWDKRYDDYWSEDLTGHTDHEMIGDLKLLDVLYDV